MCISYLLDFDFNILTLQRQARALIRASTGIADPDIFIEKHLNCDHLETQMMELKQVRSVEQNMMRVTIGVTSLGQNDCG